MTQRAKQQVKLKPNQVSRRGPNRQPTRRSTPRLNQLIKRRPSLLARWKTGRLVRDQNAVHSMRSNFVQITIRYTGIRDNPNDPGIGGRENRLESLMAQQQGVVQSIGATTILNRASPASHFSCNVGPMLSDRLGNFLGQIEITTNALTIRTLEPKHGLGVGEINHVLESIAFLSILRVMLNVNSQRSDLNTQHLRPLVANPGRKGCETGIQANQKQAVFRNLSCYLGGGFASLLLF